MNIQPKTWICTECNKSNMTGPKTITIVDDILYMEAFCRSCFSTYKIICKVEKSDIKMECVHKGFLIELEVEPKKGNGKKGKK